MGDAHHPALTLLDATPRARVLIIRFSAIGDIIQLSAFAQFLKRRWPGIELVWLTKSQFAGIVQRMPAVDQVLAYDSKTGLRGLVRLVRSGRYDLVCDMHSVPRSWVASLCARKKRVVRYRKPYLKRHLLFYWQRNYFPSDFLVMQHFLSVFNLTRQVPAEYGSRLLPKAEDRAELARYREAHQLQQGYLVLVVGAAWPQKRWPNERFVALGRLLLEHYRLPIVVLGGPQDEQCARIAQAIGPQAVAAQGTLPLTVSIALVAQAALVVGNDTGMLHAAEAVGKPVISILGPTSRETGAYPWRPESRVVEVTLPCRPCSQKGDRPCRLAQQECLLQITPEMVLQCARSYLDVC